MLALTSTVIPTQNLPPASFLFLFLPSFFQLSEAAKVAALLSLPHCPWPVSAGLSSAVFSFLIFVLTIPPYSHLSFWPLAFQRWLPQLPVGCGCLGACAFLTPVELLRESALLWRRSQQPRRETFLLSTFFWLGDMGESARNLWRNVGKEVIPSPRRRPRSRSRAARCHVLSRQVWQPEPGSFNLLSIVWQCAYYPFKYSSSALPVFKPKPKSYSHIFIDKQTHLPKPCACMMP